MLWRVGSHGHIEGQEKKEHTGEHKKMKEDEFPEFLQPTELKPGILKSVGLVGIEP